MIRGIGADIIEVERIEKAIRNPRFVERVYSKEEKLAIESAGRLAAQRAAGYFCAKEAVAKALGTGFSGIAMADISVRKLPSGAPECALCGGAKRRLDEIHGARVFLSISHVDAMAMAYAIIEGDD